MNTKDYGNIAESKAIYEFTKLGYNILQPFGDNCRYDLVIEKDMKFERIQVKYVGSSGDAFDVYSKSKNVKIVEGYVSHVVRPYTKKDIDYMFVYVADIDKSYLLPIEICSPGGTTKLRLVPPKNGQTKKIRMAIDFEI